MIVYSCPSGFLPLKPVRTACNHVVNPGDYDAMNAGESTTLFIILSIYEFTIPYLDFRGCLKNQYIENRRQDRDHVWRCN